MILWGIRRPDLKQKMEGGGGRSDTNGLKKCTNFAHHWAFKQVESALLDYKISRPTIFV